MVPGSIQGRVGQAAPVPPRPKQNRPLDEIPGIPVWRLWTPTGWRAPVGGGVEHIDGFGDGNYLLIETVDDEGNEGDPLCIGDGRFNTGEARFGGTPAVEVSMPAPVDKVRGLTGVAQLNGYDTGAGEFIWATGSISGGGSGGSTAAFAQFPTDTNMDMMYEIRWSFSYRVGVEAGSG